MHAFLRSELTAVRSALDHLRAEMSPPPPPEGKGEGGRKRDWERQCELVMRANSGLNVTDFARIVAARARYLMALDCADATAAGVPEEGAPGAALPRSDPPPAAVAAVGMGRAHDSERNSSEKIDMEAELSSSGGGESSGAWREERWTTFALEQIAAVLRELLAVPAVDHIFIGGDDDDRGLTDKAATAANTPGFEVVRLPGEGGVEERGNGTSGLQETLQAVEADLVRRGSPSRTLGPPVV